jgi:VanZ family protein
MGLAIILSRAFRETIRFGKRRIFWIVFCIGIIIALADEYYQSFVAGRQSSIYDFAADVSGSLIGTWIYLRKALHDRN